jgi:DNA-binding response OmpR family regulator
MTHRTRPQIVLAEDDDDVRQPLAELLSADGFDVTCVQDGELLVDVLGHCEGKAAPPDVLITDHRMPGYTGLEVLAGLREAGWTMPVIIITAFGAEIGDVARSLGAYAILRKPFDADDLRTAVFCALDRPRRRIRTPERDPVD